MARKPQGGKPPATTRSGKKGRGPAAPESADTGESADDSAPGKGASGEKLQKVLARAGLGSRREMERWIEEGRITVNNRPASLGDRVDDRARISVDGKQLERVPAQMNGSRLLRISRQTQAGSMLGIRSVPGQSFWEPIRYAFMMARSLVSLRIEITLERSSSGWLMRPMRS